MDHLKELEEFDAYVLELKKHDWTYDYSDDGLVWRAGNAAAKKLQEAMKKNEYLSRAYWAYSDYIWGNDPVHGNAEIRDNIVAAARTGICIAATEKLITS